MRGLPALALALLALLSGCADDAPDAANGPAPVDATPQPALPEDIHVSETMPPSADVTTMGTPDCEVPSSTCLRYPFEVAGNASITVDLAWTVPGNDLDLFLMEGSDIVQSSVSPPPGTAEHLEASLGPGSYELVVHGYANGPEPFTLDATFAA